MPTEPCRIIPFNTELLPSPPAPVVGEDPPSPADRHQVAVWAAEAGVAAFPIPDDAPRPLDGAAAWALADRIANAAVADRYRQAGHESRWWPSDGRAGLCVRFLDERRPVVELSWVDPTATPPARWGIVLEVGYPGRPTNPIPLAVPWEVEWVADLARVLAIAAAAA